ncbi:MAG: FAD binding domain-containing protein [Desulfuromonadales bacterium]
MRPFHHINARTVRQAVAALAKYDGRARLNAGGTDLFGVLKDEFLPLYPEALVNIKTIRGLDYIREDKDMLRIGALTRLADMAHSPLLRQRYGALAEAAHAVATPQIRNVATLGGNLCQDVRCCYYRYPRHIGGPINCARKGSGPCLAAAVKGDNRNHAIMEGRRCFAVCPSDTAVALALYDAQLLVVGPDGKRRVAVREFYTPLSNGLNGAEMVREIQIPRLPEQLHQTFLKFTLRKPIDFAIVSVAALVAMEDGVCSDARIALGAVAPGIVRAAAAEEFLRGKPVNDDTARQAGELAVAGAKPLSRNAYKIQIAQTLVARALLGQDAVALENVSSAYDPTELSTFHRCSSEYSTGFSTVVDS